MWNAEQAHCVMDTDTSPMLITTIAKTKSRKQNTWRTRRDIACRKRSLFWKREAAAEGHEKYDKSLTAVGDGETNQVKRVIADVLGH
jgi:hypothetical protein